jgi:hypothetical protein
MDRNGDAIPIEWSFHHGHGDSDMAGAGTHPVAMGFFGSKPFSQSIAIAAGRGAVDWRLTE